MAKKSFENPASLFISAASDLREESPKAGKKQEKAEVTREELEQLEQLLAAKGMKMIRAQKREKKIHINVTPTLAKTIKQESKKRGMSQNELINQILEKELLK